MEWVEAYFEDPIFQVLKNVSSEIVNCFFRRRCLYFFQAEALLWLELNWCDDEKPMCIPALQVLLSLLFVVNLFCRRFLLLPLSKTNLQHHFMPMHVMAMEKFMIPIEICNEEPVGGGHTHHPPTVPLHF